MRRHFPEKCARGVLAHVVGGVEGAYRRSDALEKRRALLAAWAVYIESGTAAANVIPMFTASKADRSSFSAGREIR